MPDKNGVMGFEEIQSIVGDQPEGLYIWCERVAKAQHQATLAHLASQTDEELVDDMARRLNAWNNSPNVSKWRPQAEALFHSISAIQQARQEKAVEQARANERDIAQNRINQIVDANNKALNIVEEQARQQERERIFSELRERELKEVEKRAAITGVHIIFDSDWQALKGQAPKGKEK